MDDKTLEERMRIESAVVTDGQINELIASARDEALAEIKALFRGMIRAELLERIALNIAPPRDQATNNTPYVDPETTQQEIEALREQIVGHEQRLTQQAPESPTIAAVGAVVKESTQAAEPAAVVSLPGGGQDEIQQEIEAIRKQIAENERRLKRQEPAKPSTVTAVVADGSEIEHGLGYYVYAIVKDTAIGGLHDLPQEAIDPLYPVTLLNCGPLQAVVSQVSLEDFGQAQLESHLQDMAWVEAKVRTHQDVLLALLAEYTIVPMKFCTIFRSEERVREMAQQFQAKFLEALEYLAGKQEWSVKAYCVSEVLASKLEQTTTTIPSETTAKSAGAAYFMRKKRQDAIAEEMEQFCNRKVQQSYDQLVALAKTAILLPLQKVEPIQQVEVARKSQKMLLNGAYLVAVEQLEAFQGTVKQLNIQYEDYGLTFELVGPWPPYSFVTIGEKEDDLHD